MKKFTLFCSLSMVFACGGDDDSGATSAPTTMGMDTDASTGSTGDAPTTNTPTTSNDSDPTTTGPTTDDPDTGEEESDDEGVDTTDTDEDTDEPGEAVSFAEEIWPIIQAECGCHTSAPFPAMLNMSEAVAYDNLVGAAAQQTNQVDRVSPGSANDSYLWHKVNGSHGDVGGTGGRMPDGGQLDAADIDLIAKWIDDGAEP